MTAPISRRRLATILLATIAAAMTAPLAACGKRGPLEPPPGEPDEYPKKYPHD